MGTGAGGRRGGDLIKMAHTVSVITHMFQNMFKNATVCLMCLQSALL